MAVSSSPRPVLGVIAEDFTGATDVASMLVRAGMRTVQVIGVPEGPASQADAVVVALKSRTVPALEAVQSSLAALRWLQAAGARQFYFKYCSTFDSTPRGNIGPVAEALLDALGSDFAIACPAFPENGRSIFRGHLFVGDELLSDSGMRSHLGAERAGGLVEHCLAQIARGLVERDVRHLVVAGGETSGAVVQALGVDQLRIGETIAPGVPWTQVEGRALLLALKSGNFGTVDFYQRALAQVD